MTSLSERHWSEGLGQEHVKFGHSHVIPADNVVVILGRFVLTLGT